MISENIVNDYLSKLAETIASMYHVSQSFAEKLIEKTAMKQMISNQYNEITEHPLSYWASLIYFWSTP